MKPFRLRVVDARLRRRVDADMARAAQRAGESLACRPGCTECCIGPFPITALDAWRLREGLADLAARHPTRAAAVEARAREAIRRMTPAFPGDAASGDLADDGAAQESFFVACSGLPCPALDPASGRCEVYEHRPLSCRTFGPPVRIHEDDLPPCRLCFVGAPPEVVESCRVRPRVQDEAAILRAMGDPPETVVAFALCDRGGRVQSRDD